MDPLPIRDDIVIPATELSITTARSSGPGGQHVNKVETQVTLRFALSETSAIPVAARQRLITLAGHLITREGDIVVSSGRQRSQKRNLEDCRERLRELIARALTPPKRRRKTRPTRASIERRRRDKERRSRTKSERRRVTGND